MTNKVSSIEEDYESYETVQQSMSQHREELIKAMQSKLMHTINSKEELSIKESTGLTVALATFNSLLNDQEKSYLQKVNLKIKNKEVNDNAKTAADIVNVLKQLKPSLVQNSCVDEDNANASFENSDEIVQKRLSDENIEICDYELEDNNVDVIE